MAMVGSSMTISGSGDGFLDAGNVFADGDAFHAATAMMSPMVVSVVSVRLRPLNVKSLVMRVFISEPSRLEMVTSSPACSVPWNRGK